jgi:N-acetylglucosamine malate deacetylase 1
MTAVLVFSVENGGGTIMSKHILAIHAHPDDLEMLAGGTLSLLAQNGHRVTMVTMTPGDKGSDRLSPEEIAAVRREEGRRAAELIGARYECAEFRDLTIFSDDPSRRKLVELLRRLSPDLVLTSAPVDYLCDHEATSMLVRDACFAAPAKNYVTGAENAAEPLPQIPHLYFCSPVGGVDRDEQAVQPDFVVDVESTYQTKWNMLAEHKSQREWLQRHHGMDNYMSTMEEWTLAAGQSAGLKYGEGFRRYKGHPYPQSPLLEELVGAEYVVFKGTAHPVRSPHV